MDNIQNVVSKSAATAARLATTSDGPRSFGQLVRRTFSGWITLFETGRDFARTLPVTRTQVGVAGAVALLGITLLLLRRSKTTAVDFKRYQKKQDTREIVTANMRVLELQCSDHAIVTFKTQDGPIISSNVMCSGEDYLAAHPGPGYYANSFGIDPRSTEGRRQRFDNMIGELQKEAGVATASGSAPILALQEFPRTEEVGRSEFIALIEDAFPGHNLVWGEKEKPEHAGSQLLFLVPKWKKPTNYPTTNPRIQGILVDSVLYLNIHPSPRPKSDKTDALQCQLLRLCGSFTEAGGNRAHIVGDWNRTAEELAHYWINVHTPQGITRVPQLDRKDVVMPSIDHHVAFVAAPQ